MPSVRDDSPVALVMGFGPFGDVLENPSSKLAEALHGTTAGPYRIAGMRMPVSYRRCVEVTASAVVRHSPDVVLGVGVAVLRSRPQLERFGRAHHGALLDVDQRAADWRSSSHRQRPARLPLRLMCEAGGFELSDDCGSYVCNGWMYACLGMLPEQVRVGFLHIPRGGVSTEGVRQALAVIPAQGKADHGQ